MISLVTALLAAIAFGTADFLGGFASRRASALAVAATSQVSGAVLLIASLPFYFSTPITQKGLFWGAVAGGVGAAFLSLFYFLLSAGRMGIVAPVVAVWAIAVPVGVGALSGERLSANALTGIALALPATALMSGGQPSEGTAKLRIPALLGLSVLAGVLGGLYFVCLERAGRDAGLWPLFCARGTSSVLAIAIVATNAMRRSVAVSRIDRGVLAPALFSGLFDVGGSWLYMITLRGQVMSIAVTLVSLYSAVTVVWAWLVLRERLRPQHAFGMALAGTAIAFIANG